MDENDVLDLAVKSIAKQDSFALFTMKINFAAWLDKLNMKISSDATIGFLDNISEYAITNNIHKMSLWEYTKFSDFENTYKKILDSKICENKRIYKKFELTGQLYIKFLKKNSSNLDAAIAPVVDGQKPEIVDLAKQNEKNVAFKKTVDWPFLNYGFALPNPAVENICANLDKEVTRWDIWSIELIVDEHEYNAKMINIGFSEDLRPILQIKYNSSSPIAQILQKTFSSSYENFLAIKKGEANANEFDGEEYVDVVYISPNMYKIICHPIKPQQEFFQCTLEESSVVSPKTELDPNIIGKFTEILSSRFANGCRLNSPIEVARFRSFAAGDLNEEIALSDEEMQKYIEACGTSFEGKIYAVAPETKEKIKELADVYFAGGASIIFFSEFYAKNESWLFEASVVSEDMLANILREFFPNAKFTQTYFGFADATLSSALEGEILRVWGGDLLLTYDQLAERLQYAPIERIQYMLGQNGDFIWNNTGTFAHVSHIEITEDEREIIRDTAERECNAHGYVPIGNLPLEEIAMRNHELSIAAIYGAVHRICLSDKYDKKAKIIVRKGDTLNALAIMEEYCRTIDKCSLDELLDYRQNLAGEIHRQTVMEAAYNILIRTDKDTYVAEKHVHFNCDLIDEAISFFVKGDYLPLKSFTAFGAFPDCGHLWNLFLLESYCRRFSDQFRFDVPAVNSINAGVVIRKSCAMDYTEIMADAVANVDVSLNDAAVCKFLYDCGYTGKSKTAKAAEIIEKAKAIREKRG